MTSSPASLTLDTLAEQFAEQFAALRTELDTLRQENARLTTLVATMMTEPSLGIVQPDDVEHGAAPLERLSRRWVLRRAMQATAATVVAGAMLRHDDRTADASHSTATIDADKVNAHYVLGSSEHGYWGIVGHTQSDNYSAITGSNDGAGAGIVGSSYRAGAGVEGHSATGRGVHGMGYYGVHGLTNDGAIGVYGENTGTGHGVVGDGKGGEHAGVFGRNSTGDGLSGEGKIGVRATSTTSGGYGAVIAGGKAQVRLVPNTTPGKPTSGTHAKGELLLDSAATLWICTANGTPGTWRKVSTTVA